MKSVAKYTALLLAIVLVFSLTACTSDSPAGSSEPEKLQEVQKPSNFPPLEDLPELPSLYLDMYGESVLAIDMSDPVTRSYYTGCGALLYSGEVSFYDYTIDEVQTVAIDKNYTYPVYNFSYDDESALAMAEALSSGGRFTDFIRTSEKHWGGLVFQEDGTLLTTVTWNKEKLRTTYPSLSQEMSRYEKMSTEHMLDWMLESNIFTMTPAIRSELEKRGFNLETTRVIGGTFYSSSSYLFIDGNHEVMLTMGDTIDGIWRTGDFITPEDFAAELVRLYTPQPVSVYRLDNLNDSSEIKITNEEFYKNVTDPDDLQKIITLLKSYPTILDKATDFEAEVTILIDGSPVYLGHQGNTYYYSDNSVGNCTVDAEWAKSVIALYDQLDYEELPREELADYLRANPDTGKPVIYLYPTRETNVSVKLDFAGELSYTYPTYQDGWNVTAYPDGRLVNLADSTEHYYLFWEGVTPHRWNLDQGFVVAGDQVEAFLRESLSTLGLTPREYNDFITYWVPKMNDNAYNLISFSSLAEYSDVAKLSITPEPDTVLRIHMAWMALDAPVQVTPQVLQPTQRIGFTMVEWGGTEVLYREE